MYFFGFYMAYPFVLLGLLFLPMIGVWFYKNQAQYFLQVTLSETKHIASGGWKEKGRYLYNCYI
jgi:hypothetical protein